MDAQGLWPSDSDSSWIRPAVLGLPRDRFAPDRVFVWDGVSAYAAVDRAKDLWEWADAVYPASPYEATNTQISEIDGLPSSSISCTAVVADMLDSLMLEEGHRVLELGTGAGWNAGLLARRADLVVSVEIDPELADAAAVRLKQAGLDVEVRTGDAARGAADRAPFDRVIATYAVERVPWAWVEQTRPGGRIVTPWGRLGHVALTVSDDGRAAVGWVQGLATFMPARGVDQGLAFHAVQAEAPVSRKATVHRDLALFAERHLLFAVRVSHPHLRVTTTPVDGGVAVNVHDGASSWACAVPQSDGTALVTGGGPRDVWAETSEGWDHWEARGRPELWDFGMTVTAEAQFVWAGRPEHGPYTP
ncbi:methyltransferase domain-containing protein [Streptomyces griseocarneus]|uniref:methyltransferase domain-containing protein n=1 Tax=Streptomyces griseocarneus TaxID=51201 RepID=UPI00167E8099|nr:methyltransferase domain-containing protein [Streptomyces griseocarneus]